MKELTALQDKDMGRVNDQESTPHGVKPSISYHDMVVKFKSKLRPRLTFL